MESNTGGIGLYRARDNTIQNNTLLSNRNSYVDLTQSSFNSINLDPTKTNALTFSQKLPTTVQDFAKS